MNIVANVVGAVAAISFVGYFAYKVGELPLIIIVAVCLGLMIYAFYEDVRRDKAITQARRENGRSPKPGRPV